MFPTIDLLQTLGTQIASVRKPTHKKAAEQEVRSLLLTCNYSESGKRRKAAMDVATAVLLCPTLTELGSGEKKYTATAISQRKKKAD